MSNPLSCALPGFIRTLLDTYKQVHMMVILDDTVELPRSEIKPVNVQASAAPVVRIAVGRPSCVGPITCRKTLKFTTTFGKRRYRCSVPWDRIFLVSVGEYAMFFAKTEMTDDLKQTGQYGADAEVACDQ